MDEQVLSLARRRIAVSLTERREGLAREGARIAAQFSARGTLHSSMYCTAILDLCVQEADRRAQLIWQELARVIGSLNTPPTPDLAREMRAEVERHLPLELTQMVQPLETMVPNMIERLNRGVQHAITKASADIDLFVASMQRRVAQGEAPGSAAMTVLNIHRPVGAVLHDRHPDGAPLEAR